MEIECCIGAMINKLYSGDAGGSYAIYQLHGTKSQTEELSKNLNIMHSLDSLASLSLTSQIITKSILRHIY